jgi:hypothetical protein
MTQVEWVATDRGSGDLPGQARRTSVEQCLAGIERLAAAGGYAELCLARSPFPCLAVSFRDGRGVIHGFFASDRVALLGGDGSVPDGTAVAMPLMTDDRDFSGDVVLTAERACTVIGDFLRTGTLDPLGPWHHL